ASARAISDRLADAGCSCRPTGPAHDVPYLVRDRDPGAHRSAVRLAANSSGGARDLASSLAAADVGSRALGALSACIGDHRYRLAVRFVSRLVNFMVLSRSAADAGFEKRGQRQGIRRLASGHGMDAVGIDRHSCGDSDGPPLRLPRPHHAADDARIKFSLMQQLRSSERRSNLAISRSGEPADREIDVTKSQWSFKTATELSAALTARKVSALELAQDAIGRIERHDTKINAVCVRDFGRALEAARAADAALARGERRPLLGIPLTVKESYNVAGLPTTWRIPEQKDFRPSEDALAISRVKDAGGVIL